MSNFLCFAYVMCWPARENSPVTTGLFSKMNYFAQLSCGVNFTLFRETCVQYQCFLLPPLSLFREGRNGKMGGGGFRLSANHQTGASVGTGSSPHFGRQPRIFSLAPSVLAIIYCLLHASTVCCQSNKSIHESYRSSNQRHCSRRSKTR